MHCEALRTLRPHPPLGLAGPELDDPAFPSGLPRPNTQRYW
ncbi:MAG: hypothetical protein M5R42_04350 [Rhodocyclaceae bacterium]|nr:hypothetical protein [Rhodocyclaceae bacterium]